MVILHSGSTTDSVFANMCDQMTSEQFALFLIEACKIPDIQSMLKDIVVPYLDDFKEMVYNSYKKGPGNHQPQRDYCWSAYQTRQSRTTRSLRQPQGQRHPWTGRARQHWCSSLGRVWADQSWPTTAAHWHCFFASYRQENWRQAPTNNCQICDP